QSVVSSVQAVPDEPLSAIPPVGARVIAFVAILLGGLAGGVIGYTLVDLQCDGDCSLPKGLGLLIGALICAGGMAIVAVLAVPARGGWRELAAQQAHGPVDS